MNEHENANSRGAQTITGKLSGKNIIIPNVNDPPMAVMAPPGVIHNGAPVNGFESINTSRGIPVLQSFERQFGLLIPATNTIMEPDLWRIIVTNQGPGGLEGAGLHTSTVLTPKPDVGTAEGLETFKRQFLGGIESATKSALLANPEYLIIGLSLEHILTGLAPIRESMAEIEQYCMLSWATWHEAVKAALDFYGAKRIGILTPWDQRANASAIRMFDELGFEVVSSVGFSCASVLNYPLIPDWAKEKAILELLATRENKLDAVVQCGTNMSLIDVSEKLEPVVGIPILGINAVIFWYALRENGFEGALVGAGRLLREF